MNERRESIRSNFHLRTEVFLENQQQISLLRGNIAFGGIGGFTRDLVDAGKASVQIHFSQRSGKEAIESVDGEIIWEKQDGNFTAFGIRFSSLKNDAHPLLYSYLQYADQFE